MKKSKFNKLFISLILSFAFLFLNLNIVSAFDVKRTVQSNGLVLLHSENHNLPVVMVTLIMKAGQINETEDKSGLVNLVAVLLPEGTENRKSADISEEIDFIGASLNVSAGNDYITITLSILKKDVNKGFEIFSDILLNPAFPEEEIERKKDRIKGFLIRFEQEPSFIAERAFKKEIFGEHPYGRLIEGSLQTIDNITRQDIVTFDSQYFLPNNSILSVVGDVTSGELDNLLEKYLGNWKKEELPQKVVRETDKAKKEKVIKIDRDLTQANIIIGELGINRDNPDYYAFSVMNYILGGGGFSSRLMQSIRDEMGLAYDVHSFFTAYRKGGFFQIGLQTKNESANIAIEEIINQVEKMRKDGISEQELTDAKSYLTGSFKRRLDTNRKVADFLASVEFFGLGIDYVEKYPGYINSVTKEDVLRVTRKYLDPEKFVFVIVANLEKASIKIQ
ncbi:MAG: insulinase family protein [Nitrospirae bacterium]|nr:insulinase family protein [Nitrospirota bacterium]